MLLRDMTIFCICSCFVVIFTLLLLFCTLIWRHATFWFWMPAYLFIYFLKYMTPPLWYVFMFPFLFFQCVLCPCVLPYHLVFFVFCNNIMHFPSFFPSWAIERFCLFEWSDHCWHPSSVNNSAIKFLDKNSGKVCLCGAWKKYL